MNNVNKKLESILSSVDKSKINETKRSLEDFAKTPEGKKVINQLGGIDKNKLMNLFMSMDTQDLKSKLEKADLSKLSQSDIKNVINKIK